MCGVHGTPMRYREGGISKKIGKPYNGFWSCGQKDDFGGYCDYKPEKAPEGRQGAAQRFNEGMAANHSVSQQSSKDAAKDQLITRTAIAKSLIEAGNKYGLDTVKEFNRWVALVEGRAVTVGGDDEPNA